VKTLKESMMLAAQCHLAWLNPEKGFYPTGGFEVAHDTGRWWDAMLRMEQVSSFSIPAWAEEAMLANLMNLTDNQVGLLMNDPKIPWMKDKAFINPHNLREGFIAVAALARFRNSKWAAAAGHRMLKTIEQYMDADGRIDFRAISEKTAIPMRPSRMEGKSDRTTCEGRAIEGIIWFYEATGDPLALEIASHFAEYHYNKTVTEDGNIPKTIISPDNIGHNHSYLGTLRGLILYGVLANEKKYLNIVAKTYEKSIWKNNISFSGWAPHDLGMARFSNEDGDPEGDPASCGDVAQIALWLARYSGRTDLYDDIERLVRARILPSQVYDESDPRRNGAWGIYRHPFGKGVILDVFAAVLHTLTDICNDIVSVHDDELYINMHFENESPQADIKVTNGNTRTLSVRPREKKSLNIRIPGWVDRNTVRVWICGEKACENEYKGNYLHVDSSCIGKGEEVRIEFDLPKYETEEVMKTSKRTFHLHWRGDEVVSCEPEVPIYTNR